MPKLLIYTANLGNFDKTQRNEEQALPVGIDSIEYWRCTDEDFPPRDKAMTPRLQARIVKMFGWQMKPDFDYYLWVDSSCRLPRSDSAKWFMQMLGGNDMAFFKHNRRATIADEAEYLRQRLIAEKDGRKRPYVLPRYENEDIDGQLAAVNPDDPLFATTVLVYKNTPEVQAAFKEWWYHTSRYHSIDQLSFPYINSDLNQRIIGMDYLKCPHLEYTR